MILLCFIVFRTSINHREIHAAPQLELRYVMCYSMSRYAAMIEPRQIALIAPQDQVAWFCMFLSRSLANKKGLQLAVYASASIDANYCIYIYIYMYVLYCTVHHFTDFECSLRRGSVDSRHVNPLRSFGNKRDHTLCFRMARKLEGKRSCHQSILACTMF